MIMMRHARDLAEVASERKSGLAQEWFNSYSIDIEFTRFIKKPECGS
jgi:hypothetical protein